jgi:hypothetical protein
MSDQAADLRAIASEIEAMHPVPSTFKGMTPAQAARSALRMVVELLRERADGVPDTSRPAKPEHLKELGL